LLFDHQNAQGPLSGDRYVYLKVKQSSSSRACCMRCSVVWCGVVWCGVVWCGVVWCGVVWCGVV
jgi:hypothetical protein